MTPRQLFLVVILIVPARLACAAGFNVNGLALGDAEAAVLRIFPSAHCKPLEWKSDAADRRCDDARIVVAGARAKLTVYLKRDSVRGFDLRFDVKDQERLAGHFKARWGKPVSEERNKVYREGKELHEVYKVAWREAQDRAVLTALSTAKRASLSASRGDFDEAIYRMK